MVIRGKWRPLKQTVYKTSGLRDPLSSPHDAASSTQGTTVHIRSKQKKDDT
jgi:hypothetical protein